MAKLKEKQRTLKAAMVKHRVTSKGAPIKLAADFLIETLQTRWEWQKISQVMKSKGLQPRLLYPASLSIKMEGETSSFPDKRRLKVYTYTKSAL